MHINKRGGKEKCSVNFIAVWLSRSFRSYAESLSSAPTGKPPQHAPSSNILLLLPLLLLPPLFLLLLLLQRREKPYASSSNLKIDSEKVRREEIPGSLRGKRVRASSLSPRRNREVDMDKKRDPFWDYGEDLNGKCKCKYCGKKFSGGVSRLKSHLSGISGTKCRGLRKCTLVPDHVQVAAAEAISNPNKRIKAEAYSSETEETSCKMFTSEEHVILDKLLVMFFVLTGVDPDIVQRPSFINLLNGAAKHGSHYKIPCYSELKAKLVPDLEKEIGEYVAKVKKSWETTGCTIMSDVWCDEERWFVNIFAHSIEGMVLLNALDIRKDKLTRTLLPEFICFVSEEIGANNIVQYMTKDAHEVLYEDMPNGNYRHGYETKCVAHEIHLLFKDIYNGIEWIRKVFDQAREVVTKIPKHDDILSSMKQVTKNWELKQSSTISFYSNYYMLRSIMEAESELRLDFEKDESGVEVGRIIRNSEFWSEGKEVLHALKPIFQVLRLVDTYSATSGYLYAAVKVADEAIKKIYETNALKYRKLWDIFNLWQEKAIHPIHAAAAFLNPAYMWSDKIIPDLKIREGINVILEKLVGDEEREKFMEEVMLYRYKEPKLFDRAAVTMLRISHPCAWWDFCGGVLPVLKKYAIRILSQPCSTSSRRRGMSAFETAQIEKRRLLVPALTDNHLYLRTNALLMENFNAMKGKIGKPIDLERLDELPDFTEYINGNFTSDLLNETKVHLSDGKLNCWSASARKDGERKKHLLLHFITKLPSSLVKGDEVKGEKGAPIHVILVDSNTGSIVRSGPPSVLMLAVTVIRGGFAEEAGKYWTREFFERNEIMEREEKTPLLNDVLPIILDEGMGTLGAITFNDVSSWTESGTFRLGVKTALGFCEGIRVLEGTSNAFKVEDVNRADQSICEDRIWTLNNAPVDAADAISLASSSKEFVGSLLGTSLVEPLTLSLRPHCQIWNVPVQVAAACSGGMMDVRLPWN
ncbi:hypothetical protein EUGRSUZ_E02965 [Eucalyptus grandis]|uniref:Uncharacterized protein n=2 Tax=Eucalyptus grandis TaxID=71139 RepID=A0ACC3KZ58_EUCGR|nr:hypothetical protein EUGRSUZ_E02965 [Eucalyptus grandis]